MSSTEPPPPAPVVLQDSSDRLLPILGALPVPIMVHRSEAQAPVLLLNRRFTEVFGYGVEDAPTVATLTKLAFPDPVCRAQVMAALLGAPETGSLLAGAAPERKPSMRDKSGTLHQVRLHVVRDGELAIVTVEQQPAAETILPDPPHPSTANALQTAYALTENMPGGAYTMVLKPGERLAHFAFVSRQFLEMLELSRAEAAGDPSKGFSRIHPDDRPRWLALNMEAFNRRAPFSGEARIIANGQTRWIRAQSVPRELDDGTVIWEGLLVDITALKDAEQRLKSVIEAARAYTWQLDLRTGRLDYDAQRAALLGETVDKDQPLRDSFFESVHRSCLGFG